MKTIHAKAPAKVNIVLRVIGRRDDGFHDLEMVMVPLSLADEITLEDIPSGIEFKLDGDGDSGMAGERNLAHRAATLLRAEANVDRGARISLIKKIPIAAGLGGGSSDAAAVLKGLNQLWALKLDSAGLAALGKRLGADVPFFCFEGPAFVEGTGDIVSPFKKFPNLSFLLVNPGFAVSTPWVYKQWDLRHVPSKIEVLTPKAPDARVRPLFKDFGDVVVSLQNDLEAVTVPAHPEIAEIKSVLLHAGAAGALMSGSGPTVFGVFESVSARDKALSSMDRKAGWRVFATEGYHLGGGASGDH